MKGPGEGGPYDVGEVVLMEWCGWLKVFRVVKADVQGDEITYSLEMVELENDKNPGWIRPGS